MSKAEEKFIEELNKEHEIILGFQEYEKKISDLEANLAESEKRFVVANNLRKKSDEVLLNYKTEKYGLDKTIQELRKMKLSMPEKEWYYKGFENCERQMSSHIADLTLEVKELKQQLAEKDKLIEFYVNSGEELCEEINKLNHRALNYCDVIDKANQDKVSFAIEKLKDFKQWVIEYSEVRGYMYDTTLKKLNTLINELEEK